MNPTDAERIRRLCNALAGELNKYAANSTNANNLIEYLEHLGEELDNVIEAFETGQKEIDF